MNTIFFLILGADSPKAVKKLMGLSEPGKTRQRKRVPLSSSTHTSKEQHLFHPFTQITQLLLIKCLLKDTYRSIMGFLEVTKLLTTLEFILRWPRQILKPA